MSNTRPAWCATPVVIASLFTLVASSSALAEAGETAHAKQGTTSVHRERGADGLPDSAITGVKGPVTTVDRSRNADATNDATAIPAKP